MKNIKNNLVIRIGLTAFFALCFASPTSVFAALVNPIEGQVITDINTPFLISGAAVGSADRFIIYASNGDFVCERTITSPYGTFSMVQLKNSCGSSATLGTGAYRMFLYDFAFTAGCDTHGGAGYCAATTGATAPICLDMGNTGACIVAPPSPSPSPAPSSSGSSGGSPYGTINVVKAVVNDSGGTKTIADFPLFVNGAPVRSGVSYNFSAPAEAYTLTETPDTGYTQTFSGDCDINGQVNLNPGDSKFCIITNNDIGAPVAVAPVPPLIDVVKTANPLALPAGPGLVVYTYTLRNIGTVPVTNITMVGDTCNPIILASGDTNNDSKLDVSETWVYRCTTMLRETHTNTVTTTGFANGISAVDIASATVIVGAPIVPPLIHITKIPNPLALSAGGGFVTYTKRITNPGTVPLTNVRVTDDKCSPINYISGDTNNDSKLDPTEAWIYTCRTNLTQTTTNTAVVTGEANNMTARDFAIATVVVAVPGLPNTGDGQSIITKTEALSSFYRSLSIGMRGTDVALLQTILEQKGFLIIPVGIAKGYFGTLTRSAVTQYQASVELPRVGIFGPLTRAEIIFGLE